jgi:hypothetical protein
MKREFVATTSTEPRLRAWLCPEDPLDDEWDPFVFRKDGWRVVIERIGMPGEEPVRSTWEETLEEALRHVTPHWTAPPVWRDNATGEIVNLEKPVR